MAAAEVKSATLYAVLSSVLGSVAAEYSMILAGVVIGSGIALSTGGKASSTLAALRIFLAGVGCALLFTLPLAALAASMTQPWLQLPREELLGTVAGLIGLFWRQGLESLGNFGRRWADKLGGPAP